MTIIVVGGIKGGSGKSTVATNLAVMRSLSGGDVLLIDADEKQETSTDFTVLRNERRPGGAGYTSIKLAGVAVRTETQQLRSKYADIIVDTGGRDTASQRAALTVADILLVPFVPSSFDLWSLPPLSELVAEIRTVNPGLKVFTFINRADARGSDNKEAADVLRGMKDLTFMATPIGNRKAFRNAAAEGLSVTELQPPDAKAIAEITALYTCVLISRIYH